MSAPALPDFTDPPVNETVLSIQFAPLEKFLIPHFGLFWSRIRDAYPEAQVQPEVAPVIELFDSARGRAKMSLQMIEQPTVRCWFVNDSENRLLQIQQDRFMQNWRQLSGDEVYPRYKFLREKFESEWSSFCKFLLDENLGTPQVNQCEVTYVNHIEYGNGWEHYGELSKVMSMWAGRGSTGFLPKPERIGADMHYQLPDARGRLHVAMRPVIRGRDGTEVLQVNLTARGAPESASTSHIFAWLDLGREWVVKGFADLTTSEMHQIWGKRS